MRRIAALTLALLGWTLVSTTIALTGDDATDLVAKLRKKYDRIEYLSLTFMQATVFAVSKARQSSGGSLSLAKGNRYRMTTDERVIVSDGATVWSWSKANAQVIVDSFRDDPNSLTPERLLLKLPTEYTPVILGEELIGKEETTVLKLTPSSPGKSVRWFKIWVEEGDLTILRLQLLDLGENEITYDLSGIAVNRGLNDSTFRFTTPPGSEVLDLR